LIKCIFSIVMLEDYKILIALLSEKTQWLKIIDLRIESWEVSKVRKEFDSPGAKLLSKIKLK
jgi:hypothetical protein